MKKFKFTLDPLLRVRKIEENQALAGLAKVLTRVNEVEEIKADSKKNINEEIGQFSKKKKDEISFEDRRMYYRYLDRLDSQILEAERKLGEMKPEVDQEQAKVVDARRKYRVVELLKERQKERYDYDVKKQEKKDLDELRMMAGSVGEKQKGFIRFDEKIKYESEAYDLEEEFEFDDSIKTEKGDVVSEYFKKYGMEDPGKKK
ncbi:MAG: flagellar export protein FliJ [Spirochaetia bacterium]|nr:flagellar export protein FliJ [Spirochaetia bacterium]